MAIGVVLLVLGGAEVLAGFLRKIHRLRRGGGLAVGALLTAVVGALQVGGHVSLRAALLVAVIGQILVAVSCVGVRRTAR